MKYTLGTSNIADDSTKALEWIPHDQYVQHIVDHHQSCSPFRMHSIIEFQTVPKLELGECVAAHAYNLRGLHAINSSMWPY